jgi:hypothetical protein
MTPVSYRVYSSRGAVGPFGFITTAGPGRTCGLLEIDTIWEAGCCRFELCAKATLFAPDACGVEVDREGG